LKVAQKELWDFIESPNNLDRITPPWMKFKIVSNPPKKMSNGLLIEYSIGLPIIGNTTWVSELKHIEPLVSFVDEQKVGPYGLWYHTHSIEVVDTENCIMHDSIYYKPPGGVLAPLINWLYIRKSLQAIFEYRCQVMDEIFN